MKVTKKIKGVFVLGLLFFYGTIWGQIPLVKNLEPFQYTLVNHRDTLFLIQQKGYYKLTENSSAFFPLNYIAEEVETNPPSFFDYVSLKNQLYAVHPGGGILYQLKKDSLVRIDASRAHYNQYGSSVFSYNDTLFNLGGYGLWNSKATLTYFDFQKREWDVLYTNGAIPEKGFSAGRHILVGDVVYILGAHYTDPNTQVVNENNQLLRLNLNTKTWLTPILLPSIAIEALYEKRKNTPNRTLLNYKNKILLLPLSSDPHYYEFDVVHNKLLRADDSEGILWDSYHPLMYKNYVIARRNNPDDNMQSLELSPLPHYNENELIVLMDSKSESTSIVFIAGITLLAFVLIGFKIRSVRKNIRLFKRRIYYSGRSIPITGSEYFFMQMLLEKNRVDNKKLLAYFFEDNVTQDMIIKRKNAMIEALSSRIQHYFKTDLFIKIPDPKDKRQVVYVLKKGLTLKQGG